MWWIRQLPLNPRYTQECQIGILLSSKRWWSVVTRFEFKVKGSNVLWIPCVRPSRKAFLIFNTMKVLFFRKFITLSFKIFLKNHCCFLWLLLKWKRSMLLLLHAAHVSLPSPLHMYFLVLCRDCSWHFSKTTIISLGSLNALCIYFCSFCNL